jgi:hypothetical protein
MPELSPEDIRGSDVLVGRGYSAAGFRRPARSISLMPTTASMVPNMVTPIWQAKEGEPLQVGHG